jgi:hypothetical protein
VYASPGGHAAHACRTKSRIDFRSDKQGKLSRSLFCTRLIMEAKCGESTTQSALFPLWSSSDGGRIANLSDAFVAAVQSALDLDRTDYRPEGPGPDACRENFPLPLRRSAQPGLPPALRRLSPHRLPAHPYPGSAAPCSTHWPRWVRNWCNGICWSIRMSQKSLPVAPTSRGGGLVWRGLQLAEGR